MTHRIVIMFGLLAVASVALPGCAGYRMGAPSMFPAGIATVHVPMFQSDSLRRNLGELLTEAVIKEIESQSPYKVVHRPDAESVLQGKIVSTAKRVLAENRFDEPRDIEFDLVVQVTWFDRNGLPLMQRADITLPQALVTLSQSARLIPEAGQSIATAEVKAIEEAAEQIVAQMHVRW